MAKKSVAGLTVVPIGLPVPLQPPATLTARQRELWIQVTGAKSADWFTLDAEAMLIGYVKAISSYEIISVQVEHAEAATPPEDADLADLFYLNKILDALYRSQERQARLVQSFATKMRLTPQARYTTGAAATKARGEGSVKPWL